MPINFCFLENKGVMDNWDDINDTKLMELVKYPDSPDRRMILHTKNTGTWVNVRGTTITGRVLAATKFCGFYSCDNMDFVL